MLSMMDSLITYGQAEQTQLEVCEANFTMTSGEESGGNQWDVRCLATGSNAPNAYSSSIGITINDHPEAGFGHPHGGEWLSGTETINGSMVSECAVNNHCVCVCAC